MRSQFKLRLSDRRFLFTAGICFPTERIGGEESVAAGHPVCWKSYILRAVQNRDHYWFTSNDATKQCPSSALSPNVVPDITFAAAKLAGDIRVIENALFRNLSHTIGKRNRLFRRLFQFSPDSHSKHSFL